MPIFPARTKRVLRYSTNISLVSSVGAVASYIFRANDLFDPDFTSTGHQPMGFDQMMVFYNHFAVERSRIACVFKNQATGTMRCLIRQDADNVALTLPDQILEFGGLTTDTLEGKGVYGANKTLQLSVDIPKIQGIARSALTSDPTLRGSASSSPSEVTYFHVQVWDPLGAGGTVGIDILMEQAAWFLEPRDQTESFQHEVKQQSRRPVISSPVLRRAQA